MEQRDFWSKAEQITKVAAGGVIAVYVLGFLVTSLYYSTLGIAFINPLKPRVIGAGLLFLLTAGGAYWAGITAFNDFLESNAQNGKNQYVRLLIDSALLALICSYLSATLWQMTDIAHFSVRHAVGTQILPVLLYIVGYPIWRVETIPLRSRNIVTSATMSAAILSIALSAMWPRSERSSSVLLGWLLLSSITVTGVRVAQASERFSFVLNVSSYASQGILTLTLFTHSVFPHFLPEWGGGAPVHVVLTYAKDAEYMSGLVRPALLLDESDSGFYLLDRNLRKTYFVPRASVAMVAYEQRSDPNW